MVKGLRVAVVGATGAVGCQLLSILEQRSFPVGELIPFASARSEGKELPFCGKKVPCQVLKKGCFSGVDIAFFDASDAVSKEWVPQAAQAGAWVVDNSATFRLDEDILLVIPEVNGHLVEERLRAHQAGLSARQRIFTGPNCSTAQMVVALKPLHSRWGIRRVVVSTYQSASGAGSAAVHELLDQTSGIFTNKAVPPHSFVHPIAFNCIPHIGGFKDDGSTSEERKMIAETRKLLNFPQLPITATAVRVPTRSCHGESVNVELEKDFSLDEVREALRNHPGIVLQDDPSQNLYPMGNRAAGQDPVYVGRVRRDESVQYGLNLWVVSDNLRKGAALNAVQIGELLLKAQH